MRMCIGCLIIKGQYNFVWVLSVLVFCFVFNCLCGFKIIFNFGYFIFIFVDYVLFGDMFLMDMMVVVCFMIQKWLIYDNLWFDQYWFVILYCLIYENW